MHYKMVYSADTSNHFQTSSNLARVLLCQIAPSELHQIETSARLQPSVDYNQAHLEMPAIFGASPEMPGRYIFHRGRVDEPPHQIRSYTLLFSLFLHFPYVADPPLRTSALTRPRSRSHVIALAPSDRSHLFDGHMTYDSHVFTSILSISNVPPPAVRPITRSRTARSGTFYSFAICSHSCLPFVFNFPVFTFRQRTSSPKP